MRIKIGLLFLGVTLLSCTSFREKHFFKDKISEPNSDNPTAIVPNYYKVTIKGWSFLSSSRYLSGYFDQEAVNEYFNEIPQSPNGQIFTKQNAISDNINTTKANEENNNSSSSVFKESGAELVLILSSNSEAIATQIKNTSVNADILQSLTLLANKDKIELNKVMENEIAKKNTDIDLFILKIENFISSINMSDDDENERNKEILLQLLKSEMKEIGLNNNLDSFDKIKELYYENK